MKVLAWLAFPVIATVLAMCWAAWRGWRSRERPRSGGAFASVEDFRRFTAVIAAPGPRATPERRRRFGRRTEQGASPQPADRQPASSQASASHSGSTKIAGQGS
jgi:hypothetical protein